jgi:hypothetical protein
MVEVSRETKIEALRQSIKHWEENVSAETFGDVSIGNKSCSLCELYLMNDGLPACRGCPVSEETKDALCAGSPYEKVLPRWRIWRDYRTAKSKESFTSAAQQELDFLRGLLEKELARAEG